MFNNSDLTVMFENCSNRWLVIRDVVWTFEFWNLICQYVVNLSISTLILKYLKFELSFFWCITNSYVEIIKIIFPCSRVSCAGASGMWCAKMRFAKMWYFAQRIDYMCRCCNGQLRYFFLFYKNLISKIY